MTVPTRPEPNTSARCACRPKTLRPRPSASAQRLETSFSTMIATCKPRRCANPSRGKIGAPDAKRYAKSTWPNGGNNEVMASAAFADSQPQYGQPNLTEGQNGPPPYP